MGFGLAAVSAGLGAGGAVSATPSGLLNPERVANYPLPTLQTALIDGGAGQVTYAVEGPAGGPLVLYFHGWGDDYRMVFPLEYGLVDAGFRLLVPHRPGYAGTALEGRRDGRKTSWRSLSAAADLTARLLDQLYGRGKWTVAVIGISGGAPAALVFASLYPAHTKALILQGGVTQPFSDVKYVPALFRAEYMSAFKKFGWAGDQVSQVIFALLVKLRERSLTDEEFVKALAGDRLAEAKEDPAFTAVTAKMLREDPANKSGERNDVRTVFFSKTSYCHWESITAPTLLIHDEKDVFVPIAHAEEAKSRLRHATLRKFALGGHIVWLGPEAPLMHETRVQFLKLHG